MGGRHPSSQPSRPHHLSTALARSDTAAYYPEASLQAGPRSKQLKNPPGRHFGRRHRRAANFAPSPPPLLVLPSLASTLRSRAASRPCSLDSALAPVTSAPTRRTSNPNASFALAAASQRLENISSSTAHSTPHHAPPFFPPSGSNPSRSHTSLATRAQQRLHSASWPTPAVSTPSTPRPPRTRLAESPTHYPSLCTLFLSPLPIPLTLSYLIFLPQ